MDTSILLHILLLLVSLAVLIIGADKFVGGTEQIGLLLRIPPFIMGITVLAVGTSFPELITAFFAIQDGTSEIVIGTVVGSNIANILLILGLTAIFARKFTITWDLLHGDLPILFGSLLLLAFVVYPLSAADMSQFLAISDQLEQGGAAGAGARAVITVGESAMLLAGYVLYLHYYTVRHREEVAKGAVEIATEARFRASHLFWLVVGLAGVLVGAKFTVDFSVKLAADLHIGNEVVAASLIAFGTSMPELVVSISAARRNNFELILGNVTGSNIFNTFVVLGLPGLLAPLFGDRVPLQVGEQSVLLLQLPYYGATLLLFLVVVLDKTLTRTEGWIIFLAYILFIAKLFSLI